MNFRNIPHRLLLFHSHFSFHLDYSQQRRFFISASHHFVKSDVDARLGLDHSFLHQLQDHPAQLKLARKEGSHSLSEIIQSITAQAVIGLGSHTNFRYRTIPTAGFNSRCSVKASIFAMESFPKDKIISLTIRCLSRGTKTYSGLECSKLYIKFYNQLSTLLANIGQESE